MAHVAELVTESIASFALDSQFPEVLQDHGPLSLEDGDFLPRASGCGIGGIGDRGQGVIAIIEVYDEIILGFGRLLPKEYATRVDGGSGPACQEVAEVKEMLRLAHQPAAALGLVQGPVVRRNLRDADMVIDDQGQAAVDQRT